MPGVSYMHPLTGSSLFRFRALCLFSAKPVLSKSSWATSLTPGTEPLKPQKINAWEISKKPLEFHKTLKAVNIITTEAKPLSYIRKYASGSRFLVFCCDFTLINFTYTHRITYDWSIASDGVLKIKDECNSWFNYENVLCPIALKFCTEHGTITAIFCARLQSDHASDQDVMVKRNFARFTT